MQLLIYIKINYPIFLTHKPNILMSVKGVEGIECSERSIIPKKVLRETLEVVIKSDFSKVSMGSAMKALKGESKCGDAVCDVLKYLKTQTEIPH